MSDTRGLLGPRSELQSESQLQRRSAAAAAVCAAHHVCASGTATARLCAAATARVCAACTGGLRAPGNESSRRDCVARHQRSESNVLVGSHGWLRAAARLCCRSGSGRGALRSLQVADRLSARWLPGQRQVLGLSARQHVPVREFARKGTKESSAKSKRGAGPCLHESSRSWRNFDRSSLIQAASTSNLSFTVNSTSAS
jgi:hypothetical protein